MDIPDLSEEINSQAQESLSRKFRTRKNSSGLPRWRWEQFRSALLPARVLAADYFDGKTITVQVPSGSGGTYHVYCQLVQRNIGKFIPGKPDTLIQNWPGGDAGCD
jgi:hypothetical protein